MNRWSAFVRLDATRVWHLMVVSVALMGAMLPAHAQDSPKKDPPPPSERTGPLNLGDNAIEQNQPIKVGFQVQINVAGETEPSDTYVVDQGGNIVISYQGIKIPVLVRGLTQIGRAHV